MFCNKMKIVLKIFISVFIVYIIFTPIFILYNFYGPSWIFIPATAARFFSIILLGIWFRKKHRDLIAEKEYKVVRLVIFLGLAIWILLLLLDFQEKSFYALNFLIDIYTVFRNHPSFVILLEQLLHSHLITNFLICSAIVFLKPPLHKPSNAYSNE